MNNDEIVLHKFVVNKVWEVAQACVDGSNRGWFVNMRQFRNAMDSLDFTANEVRAVLAFLEARTYVITFPNEEGQVRRISVVPQRYQCEHCNLWLNMQNDIDDHIDLCLKQQKKMERYQERLQY
jgi:hypothetical protein